MGDGKRDKTGEDGDKKRGEIMLRKGDEQKCLIVKG